MEIIGKNEMTTRRGIKLEFKKVSRMLAVEAVRAVKEPLPPTWFNEDKGRSEENPLDPAYLRAVEAFKLEQGLTSITTMLLFGVLVVHVPDDVPGPDDVEWLDMLAAVGIHPPMEPKRLKFTAWLKFSLEDDEYEGVIKEVMRFNGWTPAADVGEAEKSFRPETEGDAPNGVPAALAIDSGY